MANDQTKDRDRQQENGDSQGRDKTPHYSLESREYRDNEGDVHHHTNTYMEQHNAGPAKDRSGGSDR